MEKVTKTEIVEKMVEDYGIKKKDAIDSINMVMETMKWFLSIGNDVSISGFGIFKLVDKPERTARNPKTGEEVHVNACRVVRFKPAKQLKESV